jgi:transposase
LEQKFSLWVGIDWATEEHQICGVDGNGNKVFEWKVAHAGEAISEFADRLIGKAGGAVEQVAVAIETPRGAIVEALIDRGIAAFSINPKQADRFRDRHRVSGAKSDALDAFVLADSLRTDMPLYRRIELGDAVIVELRELRRAHDALTRDGTSLGSRLREQIHRYYPQLLELGSPYDDRWLWDLLEHAPTPAEGARVSRTKVASILRRNRIRAVKAEHVVTKLRDKALPVAPGVVAAASAHMRLLLPLVRLNREQLANCDRQIEALVMQLATPQKPTPVPEGGETASEAPAQRPADAAIVLSSPGLGVLTAATLLTEGWQALRDRDYQALRAQSGAAPVTAQTGKQRQAVRSRHKVQVSQRYSCNEHLQVAMYHWARGAVLREDRAKAHYARLRAAGHSHGRALRGIADRLLKMLVAMLASGSLYDPSRRSLPEAAAA